MSEIEKLLKQVEELHLSMVEIKKGKSIKDIGVITESQILDIVLNNYQEELMKIKKLEELDF
ncbi:aspartyl-phosphate phosphatase Spo0E family protein [Desulfosporosinus sp. PR]|uniref:Spo0E family sporulation regulatory protein-aspartic acid phosphatase n=1 Tax=Candidatus Desulfosporosinus nitrosoreducens TaxID=3401928 RepID=UPI0027F4DCC5|nr:Spo0E family sporulation regulatory protein-aspartic acid phosphatase [Desulfosporosinus sp. PR]MDQ7095269.1 aspartyl-phosphate phosphatase Spo0E family protein [Desulfosporosinus sp. PR]